MLLLRDTRTYVTWPVCCVHVYHNSKFYLRFVPMPIAQRPAASSTQTQHSTLFLLFLSSLEFEFEIVACITNMLHVATCDMWHVTCGM
jgi:hypothetical protein